MPHPFLHAAEPPPASSQRAHCTVKDVRSDVLAAYSAPRIRTGTGTPVYARSEVAAVTWSDTLRSCPRTVHGPPSQGRSVLHTRAETRSPRPERCRWSTLMPRSRSLRVGLF